MKRNETDYYARRLRTEREAAAAAQCEQARAAHLALAGGYEQKLAYSNQLNSISDGSPWQTDRASANQA
jgi:hypothetical protein